MQKKNRKRKNKKKSLKKKFFKIVFSMLTLYFVGLVCFFVYAFITDDKAKEGGGFINKVAEKVLPKPPDRTLVLLACTDEAEGRTDGIMLVDYNAINNQISIVSVPRDTKVSIPEDMWEVMVNNFPVIKNDNPNFKKINAIPNYGQEQGMEFLQKYLEDLLDVKIDYYVHFNFEGFKYIIDSVGGIEFDVPMRMKYSDPTQDLYIDLQPGMQLLDGDKSEQLLRYRYNNGKKIGYARGDLERVEVQQAFVKEFIKKVTSLDTIISNPKAYYTTLTQYIDTNFSVDDALKYIGEIKKIDTNNINTYTLPGTPETINGISFVIVDDEQVKEFAYNVFKAPTIKPEDIVYVNSFDKSIQVLNGSYTSGMAGKTKELLENKGYNVDNIGDFSGTKSEETRIYVSELGQGNDLQDFFENSKVIVNKPKVEEYGYDITIVLGTKDKLKEVSYQINE